MTQTIEAIYEDGVLKPLTPLHLWDNTDPLKAEPNALWGEPYAPWGSYAVHNAISQEPLEGARVLRALA